MIAFPPILVVLIAAVSAAIPTLIALLTIGAPFMRSWFKEHLKQQELQRLHGALKGAAVIVSEIARKTPGFTIDDGLAEALSIAAKEAGQALLEKYPNEARTYLGTIHADATRPTITLGAGIAAHALARSIKSSTSPAMPLRLE